MTARMDLSVAVLRGAFAKKFSYSLSQNPYPDMPGYYGLHKAWRFGFLNSAAELDKLERTPPTAAVRPGAPPFQPRKVAH